jgi:hypothetical protein
MLHNKRARALIVVVCLVCAAGLAAVFVTRAAAVHTIWVPNASAFGATAGFLLPARALPLNTPVSISISGQKPTAGGGGTATIVACCDGTAWSWVGFNGNGTVAKGQNLAAAGTVMCSTGAGHYVKISSTPTGKIGFAVAAGSGTAHIYIQY